MLLTYFFETGADNPSDSDLNHGVSCNLDYVRSYSHPFAVLRISLYISFGMRKHLKRYASTKAFRSLSLTYATLRPLYALNYFWIVFTLRTPKTRWETFLKVSPCYSLNLAVSLMFDSFVLHCFWIVITADYN